MEPCNKSVRQEASYSNGRNLGLRDSLGSNQATRQEVAEWCLHFYLNNDGQTDPSAPS